MSSPAPCLNPSAGAVVPDRLGDPLLDEYLRFTAARVRPNTLIAQAFDLKVFVVPPESWRVWLCGVPDGGRGVLVVDGAHHAC